MSADKAILEFEIMVTAKPSEDTKQLMQELKKSRETEPEKPEEPEEPSAGLPLPPKGEKTTKSEEKTRPGKVVSEGTMDDFKESKFFKGAQKMIDRDKPASKAADMMEDLNEQGLQNVSAFAKNPTGNIAGILQKILTMGGPEAQLLLGALGVAIATPEVLGIMLQTLSVKGGPMNRDWRFHLGEQVNEGLTRQQIIEKQFGLDPVFLSQQVGFKPNNSNWTYSSLYEMDAYRIHRIGLADKSAGIVAN